LEALKYYFRNGEWPRFFLPVDVDAGTSVASALDAAAGEVYDLGKMSLAALTICKKIADAWLALEFEEILPDNKRGGTVERHKRSKARAEGFYPL